LGKEKVMLSKAVRYCLVGAMCGSGLGLSVFLVTNRRKSQQQERKPESLDHFPEASEAVYRFMDYRLLKPSAFKFMKQNVEYLFSLYHLISQPGHAVKVGYEWKAHSYRRNIEDSVNEMARQFPNQKPSKDFDEAAQALLKLVNDTVTNIRMAMAEKYQERLVTV